MTHVATLISKPARPALDDAAIAVAVGVLATAQAPRILDPGIAVDIPFTPSGADDKAITERLRAALQGLPDRRRGAAPRLPAQETVRRRHGFHHDRAGMHRRTGRLCRPESPCRGDHRARDARRDRVRAGVARTRRAAERPAARGRGRGHRETHHAQPRRAHPRRHHAGERRPHLPRLRRLHAVHRPHRRDDRLRRAPRQHARSSKTASSPAASRSRSSAARQSSQR